MTAKNLSPMEGIERRIYLIRGHKVMLDRDLAELYGVKAIALRQQVKRNKERFPADFMFRLSQKETALLLSQNVIPSRRSLGGFYPYVFTQEGVAMISGVLNSPRAIQVNIAIMRAFVKLREMISAHKELAAKLEELERKVEGHDEHIRSLFDAIHRLMEPVEEPETPKQPIGRSPTDLEAALPRVIARSDFYRTRNRGLK